MKSDLILNSILMNMVFMSLNVLANISRHKEVFIKEDIDIAHNARWYR